MDSEDESMTANGAEAENGSREDDWNRFVAGGSTPGDVGRVETVAGWTPGEPVTPQDVLTLHRYTAGESQVLRQHTHTNDRVIAIK